MYQVRFVNGSTIQIDANYVSHRADPGMDEATVSLKAGKFNPDTGKMVRSSDDEIMFFAPLASIQAIVKI
jgi:hypothetical protein